MLTRLASQAFRTGNTVPEALLVTLFQSWEITQVCFHSVHWILYWNHLPSTGTSVSSCQSWCPQSRPSGARSRKVLRVPVRCYGREEGGQMASVTAPLACLQAENQRPQRAETRQLVSITNRIKVRCDASTYFPDAFMEGAKLFSALTIVKTRAISSTME